eukprot:965041-Rhodomonas_salina.1
MSASRITSPHHPSPQRTQACALHRQASPAQPFLHTHTHCSRCVACIRSCAHTHSGAQSEPTLQCLPRGRGLSAERFGGDAGGGALGRGEREGR